MKGLKVVFLACCVAALSLSSLDKVKAQTAFDVAELFIQGGSPDEILKRAIEANTRVEPAYLGIKFYNADTNTPLAQNEVRELMGPIRQDSAYQAIAMAVAFSNNSLALNQSQLETLVDAAFIATMRRPPEHISIEFYDTRVGPSGEGGGPSGRVPDTIYRGAEEEVASSDSDLPANAKRATPEPVSDSLRAAKRESHELVTDLLPDTDEELLTLFRGLGVQAEHRPGYIALPVVVAGRSEDVLGTVLDAVRDELEHSFRVEHAEGISRLTAEPSPGVYLMIEVGYYTGQADTLQALEDEMQGVFYR